MDCVRTLRRLSSIWDRLSSGCLVGITWWVTFLWHFLHLLMPYSGRKQHRDPLEVERDCREPPRPSWVNSFVSLLRRILTTSLRRPGTWGYINTEYVLPSLCRLLQPTQITIAASASTSTSYGARMLAWSRSWASSLVTPSTRRRSPKTSCSLIFRKPSTRSISLSAMQARMMLVSWLQ